MIDVQHMGQSKITIEVSIDKKSLKFCEHDGHSIFIVLIMSAFLPSPLVIEHVVRH